jgi:predicted dehydrogenase
MRIVLIGVSHWHTPFYSDPVLEMSDAAIVGVSDPDVSRAAPLARRRNVPPSPIIETCARRQARFRLRTGPALRHGRCGAVPDRQPHPVRDREALCHQRRRSANDIAQRAAAAGVFAAVPLVFRYCPIIDTIREIAAGEDIQYLSFKFVGGMVDRYYQQNVEWVIDRATSGGGPLLNLGIHFVDLCRVLLGNAALTVTGAMMSNRAAGLTIEDHAVMLMQGGPKRRPARELHDRNRISVSRAQFGVRHALQHSHREALFRGAR